MAPSQPHDVHDRGFKFLLSNLRLFQELLEGFVEQPWVRQLEFQKAERINKSFVLESFLEKESDILYRIPMGEGEIYVYILVEHQSTVDFTMAFRMLVYIVEFWKDYFIMIPIRPSGEAGGFGCATGWKETRERRQVPKSWQTSIPMFLEEEKP